MIEIEDHYCNELKAGDYIVYATSQSSNVYVNTGKIIECTEKLNYGCDKTAPIIKAVSFSSHSSFGEYNSKLRARKVTLTCVDRVVKIPKEYIKSHPYLGKFFDEIESL